MNLDVNSKISNIVFSVTLDLLQTCIFKLIMDKLIPFAMKLFNLFGTIAFKKIILCILCSSLLMILCYKLYLMVFEIKSLGVVRKIKNYFKSNFINVSNQTELNSTFINKSNKIYLKKKQIK